MKDYKKSRKFNKTNPLYKEYTAISDEDAERHSPWLTSLDYKSLECIKKEMYSEILMERYDAWHILFGTEFIRRNSPVAEAQRSGVDYRLIYTQLLDKDNKPIVFNVDLKASFGDYRIDEDDINCDPTQGLNEEAISIEYTQNGKVTFTPDKETTDVVYVYGNVNTDMVHFIRIPYKTILKYTNDPATSLKCRPDPTFNGSGKCYKKTFSQLLRDGCTIWSWSYKPSKFSNMSYEDKVLNIFK